MLLAVLLLHAPVAARQGTLQVTGAVATPLTLSAADLKAMPRQSVEIKEETRVVVYAGVLVGEILKKAGVPLGSDLRGAALSTYVVMTASDGYQVVFSLAELDPALTNNDVIVADTLNDQPLEKERGPFRLVAPKDSRPARGVRMLAKIDVVQLKK
jgi:DMSO/TMAO reductase YedYZ molybdopterin-dependent catalytic subunit